MSRLVALRACVPAGSTCVSAVTFARLYSTPPQPSSAPAPSANDEALMLEMRNRLKAAMRTRDSMTSQTIKSALSDIQRATNPSASQPQSAISALRKAIKTRLEAAETVVPELARAYRKEVELLETFLPEAPTPSADELYAIARELLAAEGGPRKMGDLVKSLRERVGEDVLDGKTAAVTAKRALGR